MGWTQVLVKVFDDKPMKNAVSLDIMDKLQANGFRCNVRWNEDEKMSYIFITLMDKEEHLRYIRLDRRKTSSPNQKYTYKLNQIINSEYYRGTKPNIAVKYDNYLGSEEFKSFIQEQLSRCNNYHIQYKFF